MPLERKGKSCSRRKRMGRNVWHRLNAVSLAPLGSIQLKQKKEEKNTQAMDRHRHSAGSASPALHYWYFIYFYWQTHGPKGNMPLHRRQIDATKRTHTHAHTVTTVCVLGQIKFDVWFKNFARVQWENYIRRVFFPFFSVFAAVVRRCLPSSSGRCQFSSSKSCQAHIIKV